MLKEASRRAEAHVPSSRTGVCWDNAQCRNVLRFSQVECVYSLAIPSLDHGRRTHGLYNEIISSHRRRQAPLDYRTCHNTQNSQTSKRKSEDQVRIPELSPPIVREEQHLRD